MQQNDKERFGTWLESERTRRGMSQRELADRAEVAGSTVSRAERAKINLVTDTVVQLADGLNASRLSALIEAGVVNEIDRDAAEMAVLFAGLTGDRRETARAVLETLWRLERKESITV